MTARTRRMRERNRIAQQRYRNRQRFRLQESEQRVAELTERVRVLTSDKVGVYFMGWDAAGSTGS